MSGEEDKLFGTLPDGRKVFSHSIRNGKGMELIAIDFGAVITSLKIPTAGDFTDVVLGFDTLENYLASQKLPAPPHFGAAIGRYAGRISNSKFTLDGVEYKLSTNNNANTLHGGKNGFDRVLWTLERKTAESLTFTYRSADGEEGFPGALQVWVTYTLTENNSVDIHYRAITDKDTVINLTQHSYFNLEGHQADLRNQELLINSNLLLEIDRENIPTGKVMPAIKKGMDFSAGGTPFFGIDDSFIIEDNGTAAATLTCRKNGLRMTVFSDQPSLHIYVGGKCFGELQGKQGAEYHELSGICFESQNYPDAPNQPGFPSAVLRKGEEYTQHTLWTFEQT